MRLSELQYKDIVNLEGKKIGNIIDVKIDAGELIMPSDWERLKELVKMLF